MTNKPDVVQMWLELQYWNTVELTWRTRLTFTCEDAEFAQQEYNRKRLGHQLNRWRLIKVRREIEVINFYEPQ
jgi:hypothetical protein